MTSDKNDILSIAIENIKNDSIINTNLNEIYNIKNNVFKQLQLSREKCIDFHNKLKKYRFVDEISDLNCGDYVRWIDLTNASQLNLANGAFICDVEINPDGVHIKLKTFKNRHIQLRMDEIFLFQKLNDSELVVLSALKYLEK
jgi:hypothetical protein